MFCRYTATIKPTTLDIFVEEKGKKKSLTGGDETSMGSRHLRIEIAPPKQGQMTINA